VEETAIREHHAKKAMESSRAIRKSESKHRASVKRAPHRGLSDTERLLQEGNPAAAAVKDHIKPGEAKKYKEKHKKNRAFSLHHQSAERKLKEAKERRRLAPVAHPIRNGFAVGKGANEDAHTRKAVHGSKFEELLEFGQWFGVADDNFGEVTYDTVHTETKKLHVIDLFGDADEDHLVDPDELREQLLEKGATPGVVKGRFVVERHVALREYDRYIRKERRHKRRQLDKALLDVDDNHATITGKVNADSAPSSPTRRSVIENAQPDEMVPLGRHITLGVPRRTTAAKEADHVKDQLADLPLWEPWFIHSITITQLVLLCIMLFHSFGRDEFARFGVKTTETLCEADNFDQFCPFKFDGKTMDTEAMRVEAVNPWLGPDAAYLIRVAAMFPPCMREDVSIIDKAKTQACAECGPPNTDSGSKCKPEGQFNTLSQLKTSTATPTKVTVNQTTVAPDDDAFYDNIGNPDGFDVIQCMAECGTPSLIPAYTTCTSSCGCEGAKDAVQQAKSMGMETAGVLDSAETELCQTEDINAVSVQVAGQSNSQGDRCWSCPDSCPTPYNERRADEKLAKQLYTCCTLQFLRYAMMTVEECDEENGLPMWDETVVSEHKIARLCNHPVEPVVKRPCCVGNTGTCHIYTTSECTFHNGVYHEEAQLCSEVSCLGGTCAIYWNKNASDGTVFKKNLEIWEDTAATEQNYPRSIIHSPNQWWRMIFSLGLHSGVIHYVLCMSLQWTIGCQIERTAGWLRVLCIYLISGVGGYMIGGLFDPTSANTGSDPAVFGLLAVVCVELGQNWKLVANPGWEVAKMTIFMIIAFFIGTLPFVDNYSHAGGFIFGILSATIFLPYITFGKWDFVRKRVLLMVAIPVLFAVSILVLVSFYKVQNTEWCKGCHKFNCIEYHKDIKCSEFES
jgi:membrane associated rhomboid family serine protease